MSKCSIRDRKIHLHSEQVLFPGAKAPFRGQLGLGECDANEVAIVEAGVIAPLVTLLTNGSTGGQMEAAWALGYLAWGNVDNQVAIVAAGAVDPLIGLVCDAESSRSLKDAGAGQAAWEALDALDLPSIASRVQTLQAENERLRARVEELEERHERPRRRDRIEAAQ